MNKVLFSALSLATCITTPAQAAGMVQGLYAGLMGSVSSTSSTQTNVFGPRPVPFVVPGEVSYSIGGGGAFQLGYRYDHYRLEGELLGNYNGVKKLDLPGLVIKKRSDNLQQNIAVGGESILFAGFINAIFDASSAQSAGEYSPYIGLGIGFTSVSSNVSYWVDSTGDGKADVRAGTALDQSSSGLAGQAILGISYALDAYTTIGVDARYIAGASSNKNNGDTTTTNNNNSRYGVGMINFMFNVSF